MTTESSHDVFERLNPAELVSRATDFIIKPDWDVNLYIAEKLNQRPQWVKPVLTEIEKKLRDEDRQVAIFAVTLLDTCLKNSWAIVEEASKRDFLQSLSKMALDSKTPYELQNAILEGMVTWAASFRDRAPGFGDAVAALVGKGAKLPPVNSRFEPPVNPHQAPPLALAYAHSAGYPAPMHPSRASAPQPPPQAQPAGPITQSQITEIRGRLELVFDVFAAINPQSEDVTKNEIIQEFYPICADFQTQIVRSFENGTASEGLLEQLLSLNDDLIRAKETYERLSKRAPAPAHVPVTPPSQFSQPAAQPPYVPPPRPAPSLLDFDLPPPQTTPVSAPTPQFSQLSLNDPPAPAAPKLAPPVDTEAPSDYIPMLAPPPGSKRRPAPAPSSAPAPAPVSPSPVPAPTTPATIPVGTYPAYPTPTPVAPATFLPPQYAPAVPLGPAPPQYPQYPVGQVPYHQPPATQPAASAQIVTDDDPFAVLVSRTPASPPKPATQSNDPFDFLLK